MRCLSCNSQDRPQYQNRIARDIRSKADRLQHSHTALAAESTKKAVAYADDHERIIK